jgi:peptidyl-prolyl cis-trans isomerase D
MLTKIREKSRAFSWLLVILIGVPFALWGIENYISGGSEKAIASVGHKDFFQNDVNRAYQQYSQNFAGMNIDEETLKKQALDKLIKDEVLLQHVQKQGLVATDKDIREFIQNLDYFKVDGKFDKKQYQTFLASQHISSTEFVNRVKKTKIMEQYQRSITDSSFATQYDIEHFFKIQNQQRDIDYVTIPVTPTTTQPTEAEISAYYQQHQNLYQSSEQISIEYVTLSLDNLAKEVKVTEQQLKSFYEDQKKLYSTKERRKISHILFAFTKGVDEKEVLKKAEAAQEALKTKTFAALAAEISEDKATAAKGGDLGLFEAGVMEKNFEEAASKLKLNEVSKPVKSAFGYHLIKVTELVPGVVKPFEEVKAEVTKAYQRKEAESTFYSLNDKLAEVSYQNPDSLTAVADALGVQIEKTGLFTKNAGEGIAKEAAIRSAAFSEEVLKGNNSEPVELGVDKIVVLRMKEHHPAAVRDLKEVKAQIITALVTEKAKQEAIKQASTLKTQLLAGKKLPQLAAEHKLTVKTVANLMRSNAEIPFQITEAVFKAAKPKANKPTVLVVAMPNGEQAVVSINKVTEGVMSESDKKQKQLAEKNLAKAFGDTLFQAVINTLTENADVSVSLPQPQQAKQ